MSRTAGSPTRRYFIFFVDCNNERLAPKRQRLQSGDIHENSLVSPQHEVASAFIGRIIFMKTSNAKQGNGKARGESDYLVAQAAEAEKQAEHARKRARLAKAKYKQARKAFKLAKRFAKEARKEAKIIAKAVKAQAKSDARPAKAKTPNGRRTKPSTHQSRAAAPRIIVKKPNEPSVVVRTESPTVLEPGQGKSSRAQG